MSTDFPRGASAGRVTAVILTRNEADHLPDCLRSVAWADAVLVLDSHSVDATREIALGHGAEVVEHPFQNFSIQRQRALDLVETDWVLFVDADERVSPELAAEVRSAIETASSIHGGGKARHAIEHGGAIETSEASAFWIPRVNYFWGHRLRGGGWWPDHQLRLLRVAASRYDPRRAVHELAEVDGVIDVLAQPLLHLNYASMREFKVKQKAYARLEADKRSAEKQAPVLRHVFTRPLLEFLRRFVALNGYRDGLLGLRLAAAMAWTEFRTVIAVRRKIARPEK